MLRRIDAGFDAHDLDAAGVTPVMSADAGRGPRRGFAVRVTDEVMAYITAMVAATRTSPDLSLGASPRGAIALLRGARRWRPPGPRLRHPRGRQGLCLPALRHRLVRRPEAELQGSTRWAPSAGAGPGRRAAMTRRALALLLATLLLVALGAATGALLVLGILLFVAVAALVARRLAAGTRRRPRRGAARL